MTADLVNEIRQALANHANPAKAEGMRAYMKSKMPYRGVQKPARTKICRAAFRLHPIADKDAWRDAVLDLWRNAEYREERYAALDLAGAKQYLEFRTLDTLSMFEEMVVTGAWWDYVDEVATHRLRELLERYPWDHGAPHEVLEPRQSPMEASSLHHLSGQTQGRDRPLPALRLHRA